jgi:hypothetical protein
MNKKTPRPKSFAFQCIANSRPIIIKKGNISELRIQFLVRNRPLTTTCMKDHDNGDDDEILVYFKSFNKPKILD